MSCVAQDAPRPPHACTIHRPGSTSCYTRHHCRCAACARARSVYMKRRAHNLPRGTDGIIDATGTNRRLQALARLGWSSTAIGERLGLGRSHIRRVRIAALVTMSTAARIAALYDQLWDKVPQETVGSRRTRAMAETAGWVSPLAWDDDYGPHGIDNPDATPYDNSHAGERETIAEKVEWLLDGGLRLPAIIDRLGTTKDTLWKALHRTQPELWERLTRNEAA